MSDWFDAVARDLRAAIRRDAHRPWYRRAWQQHRRPLLVALVALAVAAPALAASGVLSGGTEVSSASCSQSAGSGGGGTRSHGCTITLSDGQRFSCRSAFAHTQPDAQAVERSSACDQLRPLEQSARTRAVATQIATVRSCLLDQGLQVSGGASPSSGQAAHDAPAGELVIVNGSAPVFIGFYAEAADARRQLRAAVEQARRHGGRVVRRGSTIVSWSHEPRPDLRRHVQTCVVG